MIGLSGIPLPTSGEVAARVEELDLPFNRHGVDPYGVDKGELAKFFTMLGFFHQKYFDTRVHGIDHIPAAGRAMLVGNHSGGYAVDAGMVIASAFFNMARPRLAQGMVEFFMSKMPFLSMFTSKVGQFTGLPEHCIRLLDDDRLLMVFPEGARGTAKLYKDRDSLVGFGTGFVRMALQTKTPIIPFAFVGAGEAIPTIANLYKLGKLFGVPYIPVTPYLVALPLPVQFQVVFGEPIELQGSASDTDDVIAGHVERVKSRIAKLLAQGRAVRQGKLRPQEIDFK